MEHLVIIKPKIKIIYEMMKAGLLHHRRWCNLCGTEMSFAYDIHELYEY